jgi:hypothetical protein
MPETADPDNTPATALFDEIAAVVNAHPANVAEQVLLFMAAAVAIQRRQGLPAAGIKAEMADLLGRAVDSLTSEPDSP